MEEQKSDKKEEKVDKKEQKSEKKEQKVEKKVSKLDNRKMIKEGAPFAVLSYVLLFWILTFIFKKDNSFAYFHARQGVVIFVGHVICFSFAFLPVFGALFRLLAFVLTLVSLYGIYLSLMGKYERIYLVSDIADKIVI